MEPTNIPTATIAELQAAMSAGQLTSAALVAHFLARIAAIDWSGPQLNAVIEVNPDAGAIAAQLDQERRAGRACGPLHGIPILLKDNIDTADRMGTTAGSLALVGAPPAQDASIARRLRAAGAILLGKTNMSEWANFRSMFSSSGWCGRNGQSHNPYVLDRNPCGSSSGSAIAAAAGLAAACIGTETDGSIVCPAGANGVVGLKPTVGLTSRAGVVPISHTQDTIGPLARCVADAAALLPAIVGAAPRDPAPHIVEGTLDYTQYLDADGLRGAHIGVARNLGFGPSPKADAVIEAAIERMRAAGAEIVDPVDLPSDQKAAEAAEFEVLLYEFKADVNQYLATRAGTALEAEGFARSLAGLIAFNDAGEHRDRELRHFGQDIFILAQARGDLATPDYLEALATSQRLSRQEGLDAVMDQHRLDALVAPTGGPAAPIDLVNGDRGIGGSCGPAARAGYPLISVPAGFVSELPVGLTFMGRAFSEPLLIRLAYAFEHAARAWRAPGFIPTLSER